MHLHSLQLAWLCKHSKNQMLSGSVHYTPKQVLLLPQSPSFSHPLILNFDLTVQVAGAPVLAQCKTLICMSNVSYNWTVGPSPTAIIHKEIHKQEVQKRKKSGTVNIQRHNSIFFAETSEDFKIIAEHFSGWWYNTVFICVVANNRWADKYWDETD